MHRQRHLVKGRRVARGSVKIDLLTPFSSCPRIAKSTGVYPDMPGSKETVAQMKLMIRDLIAKRDEETLKRIYRGDLKLLDAYHFWKQGRMSQAEGGLHENLIQQAEAYIAKSPHAATTKARGRSTIKALKAKGLLLEHHSVRDLADVLTAAREHYRVAKAFDMFNNTRFFFLGFVRTHLKHGRSSHLYKSIVEIEAFKVRVRKDHHPLTTPHAFEEFVRLILSRATLDEGTRRRYAQAVTMMCFHGFRPTEFANGNWERDKATGHLRIRGTKTIQSDRVVPLVYFFKGYKSQPLQVSTLNRMFERMGSPVRVRDFRRTYSIWCELAGIQRHRLQRYLGHAASTTTDIYQRVAPREEALTEDREKLKQWFTVGRAAPKRAKHVPYADSTVALLDEMFPA